jgi:hypothetical protein
LREERRLGVFENMVLRHVLGLETHEVTGGWRRLHNNELCDLYPSPNNYYSRDKIRKNETGGTCGIMGERRNVYRVLVGKPEGKRPLRTPRHRLMR